MKRGRGRKREQGSWILGGFKTDAPDRYPLSVVRAWDPYRIRPGVHESAPPIASTCIHEPPVPPAIGPSVSTPTHRAAADANEMQRSRRFHDMTSHSSHQASHACGGPRGVVQLLHEAEEVAHGVIQSLLRGGDGRWRWQLHVYNKAAV